MSHVIDKQISEAEAKLVFLLNEIHGTPLFERAQLWVARMTGGRKLSEYIRSDTVPIKDRITVAKTLVDLLLTKQYDRLPTLPEETNQLPAPAAKKEPSREAVVKPGISERNSETQDDRESSELPAPDELRAMIRWAIRQELADMHERIARALRE